MVISAKICATGMVALVTWVSPAVAQVATPGRYQVVLTPRPDNAGPMEALLVDTVSGQTWVYIGGGSGTTPGWAPLRYIVPGPSGEQQRVLLPPPPSQLEGAAAPQNRPPLNSFQR
jgi:hypothetical protein